MKHLFLNAADYNYLKTFLGNGICYYTTFIDDDLKV